MQGPTAISLPRPPAGAFAGRANDAAPRDEFVPGPRAVEEPPPAEGATRTFWTWDFSVMPPGAKAVTATLRSLGDHAQIWVDDAAWGRTVQAADVEVLANRFNRASNAGSVNPSQGIHQIDTAYFGDLPHGIDPDPRVTILLSEMASFQGTTLDGYFNAFDQLPEVEAWEKYQQHSNERNIIYLNTAGSPVSGDYMQGVLAHEYAHLLTWGRDPEESSPWLTEMLGETAMAVNGFHTDFGHVARHQRRPSSPLESDTYVDYGAAYLFGTYLLERYGKPFIADLARDPASGRDAVEATLARTGTGHTFTSVLEDWVVANYADSRNVVAPGRHYASLDIPPPSEAHVLTGESPSAEGTLAPTGAAYIRLDLPAAARLQFSGEGDASVQVMHFHDARMDVQKVDPGQPFEVPGDAVLAVVATGTGPLKYSVRGESPPGLLQKT
ncbi:MAG: hypothetical protein FJX76_11250 [Armatimonadetes bacterium]|nr:hypothetical protein [Armatimonadota bacterium]